tara:strand:+ start:434 stop:760 length:327 start_codon:yes stop_codon:yes gene_type:complete
MANMTFSKAFTKQERYIRTTKRYFRCDEIPKTRCGVIIVTSNQDLETEQWTTTKMEVEFHLTGQYVDVPLLDPTCDILPRRRRSMAWKNATMIAQAFCEKYINQTNTQ